MVGHLGTVIDANYRNPWGNLEVLSTRTFLGFPMPFLHEYCQYWFLTVAGQANNYINASLYKPDCTDYAAIENFLIEIFPDKAEPLDQKAHQHIQTRLFELFLESENNYEQRMATYSLYCHISLTAKITCDRFIKNPKFNLNKNNHGFYEVDLYCQAMGEARDFSLNHHPIKINKPASNLYLKILTSFDLKRNKNLMSYASRIIENKLKDYLEKEFNCSYKSNYTILNTRLSPQILERILVAEGFCHEEIEDYKCFLKSYKTHYKACKKPGSKLIAIPPKLRLEILNDLESKKIKRFNNIDIEEVVEKLAELWRKRKDIKDIISIPPAQMPPHPPDNDILQPIFNQAIERTLSEKKYTSQKQNERFLYALCQLCCHNKTQEEITRLIGYKDKGQVSHLLKFSHFCESISIAIISEIAEIKRRKGDPIHPEFLLDIDKSIKEWLGDPIKYISIPKEKRQSTCLFLDKICHHLRQAYGNICT